MAVEHVLYGAGDWGVGELWVEDGVLAWLELPRPGPDPGPTWHPLARRFAAYFEGDRTGFDDVELDLSWCTPLQRAIAEALRGVAYGETVTYGELAALAGRPNAPRAGGSFCAGNRTPLVLPCHRVVAAGGIGSYGSLGIDYKRRLLELEGAL